MLRDKYRVVAKAIFPRSLVASGWHNAFQAGDHAVRGSQCDAGAKLRPPVAYALHQTQDLFTIISVTAVISGITGGEDACSPFSAG